MRHEHQWEISDRDLPGIVGSQTFRFSGPVYPRSRSKAGSRSDNTLWFPGNRFLPFAWRPVPEFQPRSFLAVENEILDQS